MMNKSQDIKSESEEVKQISGGETNSSKSTENSKAAENHGSANSSKSTENSKAAKKDESANSSKSTENSKAAKNDESANSSKSTGKGESANSSETMVLSEAAEVEQVLADEEQNRKKFFGKKNKTVKKDMKAEKSGRKKEKKVKEPLTPENKKKRTKRIIMIAAGVAALVIIICRVAFGSGSKGIPVDVKTVTRGDVEETLSTSGAVESSVEKVYYSQVTANIGTVQVKAGDAVKKGDVLLAYDENSLSMVKQKAELSLTASDGTYQDEMIRNGKMNADLSEANINLEVLNQQIADHEAFIKNQKRLLEDKQRARRATLAARQQQLAEGEYSDDPDEEIEARAQLDYENATWQDESQFVDLERSIEDAQKNLDEFLEYKAEMEAQQNASEDAVFSGAAKEAKKANNEMAKLDSDSILQHVAAVEDGVKADFNGVVTAVTAVNGSPMAEGTEMLRMQSTDDVNVRVSLSKYDLEKVKEGQKVDITLAGSSYEGEVTRINHMAEKNANNTPVVYAEISILNPDDNIVFGIEAKVNIHGETAKNAILIPVECVNTDKNGDFVYTVENNIVVRKNVVLGVSSDEFVEVKEGLSDDAQVITNITNLIVEGTVVTPIEAVDEQE